MNTYRLYLDYNFTMSMTIARQSIMMFKAICQAKNGGGYFEIDDKSTFKVDSFWD